MAIRPAPGLTDAGFDASVLSEFRSRLLAGGDEQLLFDTLLRWCRERQLLKAHGRQRTDSTHILAAVRALHRIEVVAETLRHALASQFLSSPYDLAAQLGRKGTTCWVGDKVALTETCEQDSPNLLSHVATTAAPVADGAVTPQVHTDLERTDLLPEQHIVDTGFLDAELMVTSKRDYGIDRLGPARPDVKWQAREG